MRPLHSCASKGWFPFLLMMLALAVLLPVGCRPLAPPTVGSGYQDVPSFPWPPPKPSASVDLTDALRDPRVSRLGDLEKALRRALEKCGYGDRKYYAVPRGFALVTRLEKIHPDGAPMAEPERWDLDHEAPRIFSLASYLKALFQANAGHFRLMVFVVTPEPLVASGPPMNRALAEQWLTEGGLPALPSVLAQLPHTPEVRCTALVYEFQRPAEGEPFGICIPGQLPGHTHLTKSGLLEGLKP